MGAAQPGLATAEGADPDDPATLTASEAAEALAAGRLDPEALVRAELDRIACAEARVKAFVHLDPAQAIAAAREAGKRPRRSPLHGLTLAVKDMIDTADMPTQHNSEIWSGHRPAKDAAVVASARALGAVILGKTDTHEFAAGGRLPATTNPWNAQHTAGGSSSGSAAAVAAGFATLAFGTQTAGSMLRPASFCGIFAMKPTFGTVSREGAKHYSVSLDTIGWYGRSVADLALVAGALRAIRTEVVPRESARGLRIGIVRLPGSEDRALPEARDALDLAVAALAVAGATVAELPLPAEFGDLAGVQNRIMRGEGRAAFLDDYLVSYGKLSQDFRDRVEDADGISFDALRDALDHAAQCRPVFDRLAGAFDAVLSLGAPGEAPRSLATTGDSHFQRMWSVLHVPALALPGFTGPSGLPVGMQLVAPRYRDADLLGVAQAVARAFGVPRVNPVP